MKILAKDYLAYQKETEENIDTPINLILKHFYKIDNPEKLKYDDISNKVYDVSNILNSLNEVKLKSIITLNNNNYGIVPDFQDITLGELYDLEQNITILEQMSILYRPIIKSKGDKYKIEKYSGKLEKDLFEQNITVEEMVGFANFFLSLSEEYLSYIRKSMEVEATHLNLKKASVKNGVGTDSSTAFVKGKSGN